MGDRIDIEIDVVVGGDTRSIPPDAFDTDVLDVAGIDPQRSFAEHLYLGCRVAVDRVRDVHAADGHRPGAVPSSTGTRRGGGSDIVRPMRVDPYVASAIAASDQFRDRDHLHLTFVDRDESAARTLTWNVVVTAPGCRPFPATLHLLASPSQVVSVLEMVPCRRLRFRQRQFIEVGVEAIDSLAHEIEQDARRATVG